MKTLPATFSVMLMLSALCLGCAAPEAEYEAKPEEEIVEYGILNIVNLKEIGTSVIAHLDVWLNDEHLGPIEYNEYWQCEREVGQYTIYAIYWTFSPGTMPNQYEVGPETITLTTTGYDWIYS